MDCSIDGCPRPVVVKNKMLCGSHYDRLRRHGDVNYVPKITPAWVPLADRIRDTGWNVTESGCWEWAGRFDDSGCAILKFKQKTVRVTRWLLEEQGVDMIGLVARHSCDNPPCVNPDHLLPGTQADNIEDMRSRGRGRSGNVKWTPEVIRAVRARVRAGEKRSAIERDLDMSSGTATRIMKGEIWGWVQ